MLSVNPSLECVYSIESGPCERVDVFHVSDDWIGYNVLDWFMRDMTTKELIIMADPNRPRLFCFNVCSTGSAVFFRSVG